MRYAILLAVFVVGCSGSSPTAPSAVPPVVVAPPVTVTPPVVRNPLLDDPHFDLAFYRMFATRPLYRWAHAPSIYLRTIDNTGRAVDSRLLDQTAAAIINTTSQWTGGAFGVAGLERGTESRSTGWIQVNWSTEGVCGSTTTLQVAPDRALTSMSMTLNHLRPECTCGPLVAKHELGHAMGFNHTDSTGDLMAETFQGVCDKPLSDRERFHARVAYTLPVGSLEP